MNPLRAAFGVAWRASRVATAGTIALAVLASAVPAASAWLGKLLFDELTGGRDSGLVVLLAIGCAAGLATTSAITAAAGYGTAIVRARSAIEAEDRLVGAVSALPGLRRLEDPAFLDRVRLAEQGAQEAAPAVLALGVELVRTVVAVVGFGGAVLLVWPPMAGLLAVSLAAATVSQLTLSRLRAREAEAMMATHRERFLSRSLCSDIRAAKEIRLFGLADLFRSRMLVAVRAATASECVMQRRIAVAGIGAAAVSAVAAGVALVVAATGAARGSLSIGDVTLFTAAVAGIQSPVGALLGQLGRAGGSLALFRHYLDVVATPPDLASGPRAVPVPAAGIELRDVWFRYDSAGPWVLRGVDRIVVLGEGRVTEKGKHEELLTAGGEYARLFSLQAKGYAMVEA